MSFHWVYTKCQIGCVRNSSVSLSFLLHAVGIAPVFAVDKCDDCLIFLSTEVIPFFFFFLSPYPFWQYISKTWLGVDAYMSLSWMCYIILICSLHYSFISGNFSWITWRTVFQFLYFGFLWKKYTYVCRFILARHLCYLYFLSF